jgi:TM2 domain-containing membrane protein YozV
MAALANFFIPGLGHLILGKPFQALLWFVLVIAGYFAFVVPGVVLHIFCILDAARQAKRDAVSAVESGMMRAMAAQSRKR